MSRFYSAFVIRWFSNSIGLWLAAQIFGVSNSLEVKIGFASFLLAGLIFSIVNALVKPLVVILSLPAILLSLGLFMVIVNGFMVYLSLLLTPGISMTFWNSILTGIILSLINYIISARLEYPDKIKG